MLGITNSKNADASAHFSIGAACDQLALLRVVPRDALEECICKHHLRAHEPPEEEILILNEVPKNCSIHTHTSKFIYT